MVKLAANYFRQRIGECNYQAMPNRTTSNLVEQASSSSWTDVCLILHIGVIVCNHEIKDRNRSVFLLGLRGLKQVTVLIKLLAVIVNVQLEPPFIRVR